MTIPGFNVGAFDNPNSPDWWSDEVLANVSDGVMGLFDTSYNRCYGRAKAGSNPQNGDSILDMAQMNPLGTQDATTYDGVVKALGGGQMPAYTGRSFNWSAVTTRGSEIELPAAIAQHISAQPNQYFAQVLYIKFPAKADWASATLSPFSCFTTNAIGFSGEPDLLTLCQARASSNPVIRAVWTPSPGVFEQVQITPNDNHFGQWVQVLAARLATGKVLQIRSALGGIQTATAAVGPKNTQNLTGKKVHIGVGTSFWTSTPDVSRKFSIGRGWFEDLEQTGRDILAVAADDWPRFLPKFS